MLLLFIGVYFVLAILVYSMFEIFKNMVGKKRKQSKSHYVEKLEEYGELIDDKEEKSNTLNEEIKNKKVEAENIKQDLLSTPIDYNINLIDVLKKAEDQRSIFEIEQMIDEVFIYDNEKIIKEFIKNTDDSKNFEICEKIQKKFTFKKIYELKTLSLDELEAKLKKMLKSDEYKILEIYKNTHKKFRIDGFINYLDELIKLNDPTITIYVGNKNEKYEYLDKNIKTKLDKSIYRGVKIGYRGKIYDFSLNGRNL